MTKKKVVLLQHYYNEIGGIETFLLNFCKQFGDEYDISLVTRDISIENALRFQEYANVICDINQKIKCDILILTSVLVDEEFYKQVEYKEIYQMIHSDWTAMKNFWSWEFKEYDPNTKYISVSKCAKDSFIREYNRDSVVIPNLIIADDCLRLLSCTRLTEEKGYNRMCKLCDLLEKYNISYVWDVYGTNPLNFPAYGNMVLHGPVKNAQQMMRGYDYVVQLSDTESMCITMYESLTQGTPVLCTPFPNAVDEITEGKNGYLIPFDVNLTKNQILTIVNKIPQDVSYKQEGVYELWKKILK